MPHRMEKITAEERHRIEERQRHELEGDTTYVMTRSEDRSIWIRAGAFYDKYKILFIFVAGILLALGFDFKTPKQFYAELQTQVNQQAKQLEAADRDRKVLNDKLDILIRFRCLDQTAREMTIAGVDCSGYVNPGMARPLK